jgi:hypothetical protein
MKERGSGEGTVSELLARGVLKLEYRNLWLWWDGVLVGMWEKVLAFSCEVLYHVFLVRFHWGYCLIYSFAILRYPIPIKTSFFLILV